MSTFLASELHFYGAWGAKIHHMDVHSTKPWVVAVDEQDRLVLWDFEHQVRLQETDLTFVEEERIKEQERDEKVRENLGNIVGVRFYDQEIWEWDVRMQQSKHSADGSSLAAIITGTANTAALVGAPTNWIILVTAYRVYFLDCHSLHTKAITSTMLGQKSPTCVAFMFSSHVGDLFFVGCSDGVIVVFRMDRGTPTLEAVLSGGHTKAIRNLVVFIHPPLSPSIPSSCSLISSSVDGRICIWDTQNLRAEPQRIMAHEEEIYKILIEPSSGHLYSFGADNKLCVWRIISQTQTKLLRRADVQQTATKIPFTHFDLMRHPNMPPSCVVMCGKDSKTWWTDPMVSTTASSKAHLFLDLIEKLPPSIKRYKIYHIVVHPLQPHLFFCATNLGVVVVSVHLSRKPLFSYSPPLALTSGITAASVPPNMSSSSIGGRMFTLRSGQVFERSVFDDSPNPDKPLTQLPTMAPHANLLLSPSSEFLAVFSPHQRRCTVFRCLPNNTSDKWPVVWDDVCAGFVWASLNYPTRFAVLRDGLPVSGAVPSATGQATGQPLDSISEDGSSSAGGPGDAVPSKAPSVNSANTPTKARQTPSVNPLTTRRSVSKSTTKSDNNMMDASINAGPRRSSFNFMQMMVVDNSAVTIFEIHPENKTSVENIASVDAPPRAFALTGGLMLGTLWRGDEGDTCTMFTWSGQSIEGASFVAPQWLLFSPDNKLCLLAYDSVFSVFSTANNSFRMISQREHVIVSAVWHHHMLLYATPTEIYAHFPNEHFAANVLIADFLHICNSLPVLHSPYLPQAQRSFSVVQARPIWAVGLVAVIDNTQNATLEPTSSTTTTTTTTASTTTPTPTTTLPSLSLLVLDSLYRPLHRFSLDNPLLLFYMFAGLGRTDRAIALSHSVPACMHDNMARFLCFHTNPQSALQMQITPVLRAQLLIGLSRFPDAIIVLRNILESLIQQPHMTAAAAQRIQTEWVRPLCSKQRFVGLCKHLAAKAETSEGKNVAGPAVGGTSTATIPFDAVGEALMLAAQFESNLFHTVLLRFAKQRNRDKLRQLATLRNVPESVRRLASVMSQNEMMPPPRDYSVASTANPPPLTAQRAAVAPRSPPSAPVSVPKYNLGQARIASPAPPVHVEFATDFEANFDADFGDSSADTPPPTATTASATTEAFDSSAHLSSSAAELSGPVVAIGGHLVDSDTDHQHSSDDDEPSHDTNNAKDLSAYSTMDKDDNGNPQASVPLPDTGFDASFGDDFGAPSSSDAIAGAGAEAQTAISHEEPDSSDDEMLDPRAQHHAHHAHLPPPLAGANGDLGSSDDEPDTGNNLHTSSGFGDDLWGGSSSAQPQVETSSCNPDTANSGGFDTAFAADFNDDAFFVPPTETVAVTAATTTPTEIANTSVGKADALVSKFDDDSFAAPPFDTATVSATRNTGGFDNNDNFGAVATQDVPEDAPPPVQAFFEKGFDAFDETTPVAPDQDSSITAVAPELTTSALEVAAPSGFLDDGFGSFDKLSIPLESAPTTEPASSFDDNFGAGDATAVQLAVHSETTSTAAEATAISTGFDDGIGAADGFGADAGASSQPVTEEAPTTNTADSISVEQQNVEAPVVSDEGFGSDFATQQPVEMVSADTTISSTDEQHKPASPQVAFVDDFGGDVNTTHAQLSTEPNLDASVADDAFGGTTTVDSPKDEAAASETTKTVTVTTVTTVTPVTPPTITANTPITPDPASGFPDAGFESSVGASDKDAQQTSTNATSETTEPPHYIIATEGSLSFPQKNFFDDGFGETHTATPPTTTTTATTATTATGDSPETNPVHVEASFVNDDGFGSDVGFGLTQHSPVIEPTPHLGDHDQQQQQHQQHDPVPVVSGFNDDFFGQTSDFAAPFDTTLATTQEHTTASHPDPSHHFTTTTTTTAETTTQLGFDDSAIENAFSDTQPHQNNDQAISSVSSTEHSLHCHPDTNSNNSNTNNNNNNSTNSSGGPNGSEIASGFTDSFFGVSGASDASAEGFTMVEPLASSTSPASSFENVKGDRSRVGAEHNDNNNNNNDDDSDDDDNLANGGGGVRVPHDPDNDDSIL